MVNATYPYRKSIRSFVVYCENLKSCQYWGWELRCSPYKRTNQSGVGPSIHAHIYRNSKRVPVLHVASFSDLKKFLLSPEQREITEHEFENRMDDIPPYVPQVNRWCDVWQVLLHLYMYTLYPVITRLLYQSTNISSSTKMAMSTVTFQKLNKKKTNFCRISRNTGLLQGKVLSPMYLNDLASHFITENCPSVEFKVLNLFVLKFADDTVIFANFPHELI